MWVGAICRPVKVVFRERGTGGAAKLDNRGQERGACPKLKQSWHGPVVVSKLVVGVDPRIPELSLRG